MSARKDGKKARRGSRRELTPRSKVVPQCKMAWPKMIQFLLDYPDAVARSFGRRDFAGRTCFFYFTIRKGELHYDYCHDEQVPEFEMRRGTAATHDFTELKWFEAYEPKCACPKCTGHWNHCCCCCCSEASN